MRSHRHPISTEKLETVRLNDLKGISVLFDNDLFELALLIVKMNLAKDEDANRQPTGSRQETMTTLNGLARYYAILTGVSSDRITEALRRADLSLGAAIEADAGRSL